MKKVHAIAMAAAVLAGGVALASPASADQPVGAQILGPVRIDGDVATVTARYNCDDSEHLWVSAKQVGDRSKDARLTEEGSSAVVAQTGGGWWQSHPLNFECDGETHIATFTIGTFEYGISTLEHGKAWLQFCLTDESTGALEINETRWVEVI